MGTTTVKATGLTCNHCAMSVTEELEELAPVTGVSVEVVKGGESTVTIEHSEPLAEDQIDAAIAEAGFSVVR